MNDRYARDNGINPADVVDWLEAYLEALPFVAEAWQTEEIFERESSVAKLYRHSWYPGRSGDLVIQNAEGCLITGSVGTTHGTPYAYDRRIPLIFMGTGIAPGRVNGVSGEEVHSIDIAPTLADWLAIDRPADLDGNVLELRN